MIETTGTGKNVEKAIEDALVKLKTSRDNVDIKIIETGGMFKKAKVQVSISEEFLKEYKKKEKQEFLKEEKQKPQNIKEIYEKVLEAEEKPTVKVQEKVKTLSVENKEKIKVEEEIQETLETKKEPQKAKEEISEAQIGKEFLEKFIKLASIKAVVDVFEDETEIFYTILGEEAATLIGYRGESLNSLQFLVSVLNGKNNRRNKRVRIDIDGYREKRKGTLELLARRVAKKVQKTGRQTRLEPMSAFERRIIHTTIQEFEGVSSVSRGEEPHRYLIIRKDKSILEKESE